MADLTERINARMLPLIEPFVTVLAPYLVEDAPPEEVFAAISTFMGDVAVVAIDETLTEFGSAV